MSPFPKEPGPPDYHDYLCSPAELKASYDCCRALRVPVELKRPQKILPKSVLASRRRDNSLLLTSAEEVITPHHYAGPQKHHIYILCAPELVALKILAAPEVLAAAEEAGVKPGTVFTEESCGTNALALAREHNRLVAIRGEQHYCKLFKDWWCVAGPLKDPAGSIIGYLDISLPAEKELGLAGEHLRTLAARIEDRLLLAELRARQRNGAAPVPFLLPPEVAEKLTPREREILEYLILEFTNQEIAAKLYLSLETVKKHRRNIYRKVGVQDPREFLRRLRNRPLY
ncbi:MAG: LuxR C-terminal-related transcriptional regulator [Bacillota bacterium]